MFRNSGPCRAEVENDPQLLRLGLAEALLRREVGQDAVEAIFFRRASQGRTILALFSLCIGVGLAVLRGYVPCLFDRGSQHIGDQETAANLMNVGAAQVDVEKFQDLSIKDKKEPEATKPAQKRGVAQKRIGHHGTLEDLSAGFEELEDADDIPENVDYLKPWRGPDLSHIRERMQGKTWDVRRREASPNREGRKDWYDIEEDANSIDDEEEEEAAPVAEADGAEPAVAAAAGVPAGGWQWSTGYQGAKRNRRRDRDMEPEGGRNLDDEDEAAPVRKELANYTGSKVVRTGPSRPAAAFVSTFEGAIAQSTKEARLPTMSEDGGSQMEFEEYWKRNARPAYYAGGWVMYHSHPQVNVEMYWYNELTGETSFLQPTAEAAEIPLAKEYPDLQGEGPEWEMSVRQIKEALYNKDEEHGLNITELAKRAVHEYEMFTPRVLSWHDYQHITFWFFGGMQARQRRWEYDREGNRIEEEDSRRKEGFFQGGAGPDLFASKDFFLAAAKVLESRLAKMHPICLTYFIWTFTRAEVVVPSLMRSVGTHFSNGLLPQMDRCSLGTIVWTFGKLGVRHDRLFEDAAAELARPNRLRSLAPRNFQNIMIAYGARRHYHEILYTNMARGISRLLDDHDPPVPKLGRETCFPYTCKEGSEVLADAFRISGLTVILRAFHKMRWTSPTLESAITSMAWYVRRSLQESPRQMIQPGDACNFMLELCATSRDLKMNIKHVLYGVEADFPDLVRNAPRGQGERLRNLLQEELSRDYDEFDEYASMMRA